MTQDEIIRMAREAGLYSGNPRTPGTGNMIIRKLERFAALVAAHEREACAKVCEQIDTAAFGSNRPAPNDCAAAIRNRSDAS